MWILPKSLMSAFAPGTEALTSDSAELSQICAQSLMRRSKPSPAKTYLREWKAGNLMRLRSGAISSPSLGQSFLAWWTFSLGATPASHLAQPESEQEQTTQDTFGRLSQVAFKFYDPDCASSRTWKDTLALDSERSLQIWKALVTKRRGEYSRRLNAVRRTSESECSSWPTATTRDYKDTGDMSQSMVRKDGKKRMDTLGRVIQVNLSTHGSRPESWLTPRANEPAADANFVARNADRGEHCHVSLTSQAKAWATPRAEMDSGAHRGKPDTLHSQMKQAANGKLNPRWVETLMGLPVGWTMPSCASPVTIAPTSCGYSATE